MEANEIKALGVLQKQIKELEKAYKELLKRISDLELSSLTNKEDANIK